MSNDKDKFNESSSRYLIYLPFSGWMGYSDDLVKELCAEYIKLGFKHFKVKVGHSLEDDYRRCNVVRKCIGDDKTMVNIFFMS